MPTIAERFTAFQVVAAALIEDMKLIYDHKAMTRPPKLYGTPNEKFDDLEALQGYHLAVACEFVAAKTAHEAKKKPAAQEVPAPAKTSAATPPEKPLTLNQQILKNSGLDVSATVPKKMTLDEEVAEIFKQHGVSNGVELSEKLERERTAALAAEYTEK